MTSIKAVRILIWELIANKDKLTILIANRHIVRNKAFLKTNNSKTSTTIDVSNTVNPYRAYFMTST